MPDALIYHPDHECFKQLQADMKRHGWSIDACNGMLEMLRLIEKNGYEIVILNSNHLNTELCVLLEMIKRLEERPRILLNLHEEADTLPQTPPALNCTIIRGMLTGKKLLEAIQGISGNLSQASGGLGYE